MRFYDFIPSLFSIVARTKNRTETQPHKVYWVRQCIQAYSSIGQCDLKKKKMHKYFYVFSSNHNKYEYFDGYFFSTCPRDQYLGVPCPDILCRVVPLMSFRSDTCVP